MSAPVELGPNGQASAAGADAPQTSARATSLQTTAGPPSGYSRRGNHSPRLWFKTVRAGFLAHGSSVIRPLSWAPYWACDLHVGASPFRVIHTSLDGVLTASAALLVPSTYLPPSPPQHIRWLSQPHALLGESLRSAASGCHLLRGEPDTGLRRS